VKIEEVREMAHNVELCNPDCNAWEWRDLFLRLLDVYEVHESVHECRTAIDVYSHKDRVTEAHAAVETLMEEM
jgi:hypothetical protein